MATENPLWGEERIASELIVKLGIRISPRTVRKYMPLPRPGIPRGDQRWSTFLKNHAKAIIACDFFVAVTATFRMVYVFVVIEHGTRRLAHVNVTGNPTADWTLQQLREAAIEDASHEHLIHDRDRIFSKHLDWMIPMSEAHLRAILKEWVTHYNGGRPHTALGPGVPDPPEPIGVIPKSEIRYRLAAGAFVRAKSVLGGLHHEYSLAATPVVA
jgi:transposase InsO family protein